MKTNERSELLLGKKALETLNDKTVLVVGVGGVGSFCVEALARTGVGHLILIDEDCVEPSNINRQLVATLDTVDQIKVNVLKERIRTLNPNCIVDTFSCIFQGIIPYGAQMLVAISAVSELGYNITAFQILPKLFYPMLLLVSSLIWIYIIPERKNKTNA